MDKRVYGYVRVSTKEQHEDRQIEAINEYANTHNLEVTNILTDKESGKDFNRPRYQVLKNDILRKGDILIIKELDRLGRDYSMIKTEWQDLLNLGVDIIIIDMPILNTENRTDLEKRLIGNIVFELFSYMAEKERQRLRKRQREGIDIAKAKGKHLGRPKIDLDTISKKQRETIKELYPSWKEEELTAVKFMEEVDLRKNTFYKIIKQYEATL